MDCTTCGSSNTHQATDHSKTQCDGSDRNRKKPKISSCEADSDSLDHCPSERVPAPTRFVRRPSKEAQTESRTSSSQSDSGSAYCEGNASAAIKIDDDVWRVFSPSNTANTQAAYYIAHRQHVAGEIVGQYTLRSETQSGSEQWNEILRALIGAQENEK